MSVHKECEQSRSVSTSRLSPSPEQRSGSGNGDEEDVLFETVNGKGIITLNRPKALHALNLSMVRKIYPRLREWESSQKFVIIKSSGKTITYYLLWRRRESYCRAFETQISI